MHAPLTTARRAHRQQSRAAPRRRVPAAALYCAARSCSFHDVLTGVQTIQLSGNKDSALGEMVNFCIDAVLATCARLLDLPLFVVLGATGIAALVLLLMIRRLGRGGSRPALVGVLRACLWLLVLLVAVALLDRRLDRMREQIEQLRSQASETATALLETVQGHRGGRERFLSDVGAAESALREHFEDIKVRPVVCDAATDIVRFHAGNPLVEAVLAVVDLQCADLQIVLDADFATKGLTSVFARAKDCTVAINGEAGNSPRPLSGLGRWRGNMVIQGVAVLQEVAANPRPFLAFDRQNHAAYTSATAANRALKPDAFNVIWGRVDVVVDGSVLTADYRYNQSRTAMGVDRDGRRLFLLVGDGRQPKRSWGFTRAQAGWFLQAFGVHDAMLCDEGGSSCMYVRKLGGLCTVPSDNEGEERPTYTHFGIVVRDDGSVRK